MPYYIGDLIRDPNLENYPFDAGIRYQGGAPSGAPGAPGFRGLRGSRVSGQWSRRPKKRGRAYLEAHTLPLF